MIRFVGLIRVAWVIAMFAAAVSCNVHEWPEAPEKEQYVLRLVFDTEFTPWNHTCDGLKLTDAGRGAGVGSVLDHGYMHYIVRAYPKINGVSQQRYYDEFEFSRNVMSGYDCDLTLDLAAGDYTVKVWSELTESEGGSTCYDTGNFREIRLSGDHAANTDYRDAFRGTVEITVESHIDVRVPDCSLVEMERPLAKYEFVLTEMQSFLDANGGVIGDYEAVVYYTAFMPCAYNMFTDRANDSSTGVSYSSEVVSRGSDEATLCFDYVFVGVSETAVQLRMELRRKSDKSVVSRTEELRVPLLRGELTVVRGVFTTTSSGGSGSSGGVGVEPGFDGDYNIEI